MNDYLCAVLLNETYSCQGKYNDIKGVGTPEKKYLNPCILTHHVGVFYFKDVGVISIVDRKTLIRQKTSTDLLVNWTGERTVAINPKSVTCGILSKHSDSTKE